MDTESEYENHVKTHPRVWIPSGKSRGGIPLWYSVPRDSEEHEEYLKTSIFPSNALDN